MLKSLSRVTWYSWGAVVIAKVASVASIVSNIVCIFLLFFTNQMFLYTFLGHAAYDSEYIPIDDVDDDEDGGIPEVDGVESGN